MTWIFAVDELWRIGYAGEMLFAIPDDLRRFKEITWGHVLLMGRKTYDALPVRPLKGRKSIVLSRNIHFSPDGVDVARSKEDALSMIEQKYAGEKIFCIGGGEVARMFLPETNAAHITHVQGVFTPYDTQLPDLTDKGFMLKELSDLHVYESYRYRYAYYERNRL